MRLARLGLLFVALSASAADDELVLRWNAFARAATEYVRTIDINSARRQAAKEKLNQLWQQLYDCTCF